MLVARTTAPHEGQSRPARPQQVGFPLALAACLLQLCIDISECTAGTSRVAHMIGWLGFGRVLTVICGPSTAVNCLIPGRLGITSACGNTSQDWGMSIVL